MYFNLLDDLRIFFVFLMENCKSRNGMIQKLHCCFCEYQQDNPRKSIEKDAKEGDIIKNIEGIYKKDIKKQEEVESRIKEKMDKLWK